MADTVESLSSRIEELEIRYMHQQAWIDDLNQVIREQNDTITHMRHELERLKDNLTEHAAEEKPPHY